MTSELTRRGQYADGALASSIFSLLNLILFNKICLFVFEFLNLKLLSNFYHTMHSRKICGDFILQERDDLGDSVDTHT